MAHDVVQRGLIKYKYKDQARSDITNLVQQYTDLRPKLDYYVFNTGERKELICLEGTVPVSFRSSKYNIPICLWLMDTHPYNPPLAFVKPTSSMQIKPSRHVDIGGRIYLPFLTEWRHPTSDLIGLVQVLTIIFGEDCPVFSKAAAARPNPPYPSGGMASGRPPPYPVAGQGYGMPMPGSQPPSYPSYNQSGGGGYNPPTSNYGSGYPSGPYPASGYPYPQPPAQVSQHFSPPFPTPVSTVTANTTHSRLTSQPSLSDADLKASLLSAVEDKMRRRLKEIYGQAQGLGGKFSPLEAVPPASFAEVDALHKTQDDLNKNKVTINNMIEKLEKEQADVDRNCELLQVKTVELKEALLKLNDSEELDIDEAVVTTAPLYKQLLHAFAEEQAIEDSIYYLGEALRREIIDLDMFLKQVRELARKQFMLRALISKCRQKAGLPDVAG